MDINKFTMTDMSSRKTTSGITYQTEFMIKLLSELEEAKDIIQRYKLSIIIENEEIDENDMDVPSIFRGLIIPPKIVMRLDYVDYIVAKTIQSTIESWVNSLAKEEENNLAKFVNKHEAKLQTIIPTIIMATPFIGAIILINNNIYNMTALFKISLLCIILLIIFKTITEVTIKKILHYSTILMPRMKIHLTLGDQDRIKTLKSKRKRLSNTIYCLFCGYLLTIFFNLLSSWIFTKIL